jgi:ribonuclease HII
MLPDRRHIHRTGARPELPSSDGTGDILGYETTLWERGLRWVAGVDEVGRGPLAGPVVAAAVVLPVGVFIEGATDSKRLPEDVREGLADQIRCKAAAVAVGAASVAEIDRLNILRATTRAMARALDRLPRPPDHVAVDGLPVRGLGHDHEAIVGGDLLVHSIACASIVAKVCRDRLMKRLDPRYPCYGWVRNVGYGTAEHREALRKHGPSPHHRLTFAGLQYELDFASLPRGAEAGPNEPPA